MTHPLMLAAAAELAAAEDRRIAERERRFRTWGPRSVSAAATYAGRVLGEGAAALEWEVLGLLPVEEHLQATAPLGSVGGQQLDLYYSGDGEVERIALRASCGSCPSQMVHDVASLEQLGRLLSQTPAWQLINPLNGEGA
ncbi:MULTISPECIES: DUF6195 family protein [Streptomyces]|uniref:DUF6195 family protein n=1 Tax=Streptomyces ramulosus TaxID=47762 RepID=A0ABW1FLA5_9ACTN